MNSQQSPLYDVALTIICGGIAIASIVLALGESPSWQAVTALLLITVTVILLGYSLWHLRENQS